MAKNLTRRQALGTVGLALGAGVLGVSATRTPPALAKPDPGGRETPWPYRELDPAVVAERGYHGYYKGHCMYGAFESVVGELADRFGAPYKDFPFGMMGYGAGGVAGWATLCGALNGAAAAIYLLSSSPKPVIDELFSWYTNAKIPEHRPENPKFEIVPSVSGSPLCHVSVGRWCEVSGFSSFSKQRSERCAWLTAEVSRKSAELLNAQAQGQFAPVHPIPKEVQECRGCHGKGGDVENTRGKMSCTQCHQTQPEDHPVPFKKT